MEFDGLEASDLAALEVPGDFFLDDSDDYEEVWSHLDREPTGTSSCERSQRGGHLSCCILCNMLAHPVAMSLSQIPLVADPEEVPQQPEGTEQPEELASERPIRSVSLWLRENRSLTMEVNLKGSKFRPRAETASLSALQDKPTDIWLEVRPFSGWDLTYAIVPI